MPLERQPGFYLLGEGVSDGFVKFGEDLHRELRLDASIVDEVVDRVDEGFAHGAVAVELVVGGGGGGGGAGHFAGGGEVGEEVEGGGLVGAAPVLVAKIRVDLSRRGGLLKQAHCR